MLRTWCITSTIFSRWVLLACVASVSVGFGSKEQDFWCFACAENGERAKNEIWGKLTDLNSCLPVTWPPSSSWQMHWPCYSLGSFGHWVRFYWSVCPSPSWKTCHFAGVDSVVVVQTVVYKTSAGVSDWPSPPCGQGSVAWAYLSAAHDRSPLLFPYSWSPHPLKFGIPTGSTMVAWVFSFLAWCELLVVSRDVCPPRT